MVRITTSFSRFEVHYSGEIMQDHIFRMYDVRGIVGKDFLLEDVTQFARALAYYYRTHGVDVQKVSLCMDERDHSPLIKQKLITELLDAGISVIDCGLAPTPVSYFSEYWLPVQGAIMITASHNPSEYNGLKISLHKQAICGADLQVLKTYFFQKKSVAGAQKGTYSTYALIPDYIQYLKRLFPHLVGLNKKFAFDCGSGATAAVVPELCRVMEWSQATVLSGIPGVAYRTHEADPSVPETMQELAAYAREHSIEFGMGFDGDGDRMGVVFADGTLIAGDRLLAVLAEPIFKTHAGANVVAEIKCSNGLTELVEQWQGTLHHCPAGRTFIKKAMAEHQALVAGELSCHFFFHDRYFGFDDGIYAALRLIEHVEVSQKSLSLLLSVFPDKQNSPELRISCPLDKAPKVIDGVAQFFAARSDARLTTIDGIRVDCAEGWGIVRASNTQPVICLRFEANTTQGLEHIKQEFVESLKPYFSKEFLEQHITW